jgi:hypothetical protein
MCDLFGTKNDGYENKNKGNWDQYVVCKNDLKDF